MRYLVLEKPNASYIQQVQGAYKRCEGFVSNTEKISKPHHCHWVVEYVRKILSHTAAGISNRPGADRCHIKGTRAPGR